MSKKKDYNRRAEPEQDSVNVRHGIIESDSVRTKTAKERDKSSNRAIRKWVPKSPPKPEDKLKKIWKKEAPWSNPAHRKSELLKCPKCKKLTTFREYYMHMCQEHPKTTVECPICGVKLYSEALWHHFNDEHQMSIFGNRFQGRK